MTIQINANGRPYADSAAATVRAAMDDLVAKGATVVRIEVERDDYISAAIKIRGIDYRMTFSEETQAAAPATRDSARTDLATPKQIALLNKFGHGTFPGMTKGYASACIADILANR